MTLWAKKPLRAIHDPTTGGYWFSVIDLCAHLTDSNHQAARGYWKQFKHRQTKLLPSVQSNHVKLKATDGKYYYTEVVDFPSLVRLIQICPHPKANQYRLWLADMLFAGVSVQEMEQELAKLGAEAMRQVMDKYEGSGQYARMVINKEKLL